MNTGRFQNGAHWRTSINNGDNKSIIMKCNIMENVYICKKCKNVVPCILHAENSPHRCPFNNEMPMWRKYDGQ